jgi:hypothetical protein
MYGRGSQTVERPPPGAMLVLWGVRVLCMSHIFILNEIWAQGKIYILVSTLVALLYNLNFSKVYINLEKYDMLQFNCR